MYLYLVSFIGVAVVVCLVAEIAFKIDMKRYKKKLEKESLKSGKG